MARVGSKQLILDFFLANLGQIVESRDIQAASGGAVEWARRVRELRNEEGYSKETRAFVLERNGYTCQMCGNGAGNPDPFVLGRTVRLTIGHIVDKSKGGLDTPSNLRAVCTSCNEGLQNTAPQKPDRIHLLAQIRRATIDDQRAVLDWLVIKFKNRS